MKTYNSIPFLSEKHYGKDCVVFYKYDGSNIRAEWNKKQGWYKFGTRHLLLSPQDTVFGKVPDLFLNTISEKIEKVLVDKFKSQSATVYFEYFGDNSEFGWHSPDNDNKQVVLFDVNIYKRGFISPYDFKDLFPDQAKVVHEGKVNDDLFNLIRKNGFEYKLNEGVICKGLEKNGIVWMAKQKTDEYMIRLKQKHGQDWEKYL